MTRGCRLLQVGGCRTTGGAFEKKFLVRNFKVTICVDQSRLMGRFGRVVAHERSTVYFKYHCRVFHLLCTVMVLAMKGVVK